MTVLEPLDPFSGFSIHLYPVQRPDYPILASLIELAAKTRHSITFLLAALVVVVVVFNYSHTDTDAIIDNRLIIAVRNGIK